MHYATLHQVRLYIKSLTSETADDELLTTFIRQMVRSIDTRSRRRFDIRQETRLFDVPQVDVSREGITRADQWVNMWSTVPAKNIRNLRLDEDLISVATLTNGDEVEVSSDDYVLLRENRYPKYAIRLTEAASIRWEAASSGNTKQVISVEGLWGYHDRPDDAFVDTLDTVQDDPLTDSATSLTVNDADGIAGDAVPTRFQVGNMIRIEDEYLFTLETDTDTNVLTVTRGYNGTTAAAHVQDTQIDVYRPMDNIVLATIRGVVWRYRQKDVDVFDKTQILGTGVMIIPSNLPADVLELLPAPKPLQLSENDID